MADAIELATAYVQIVPSMRGVPQLIEKELGGPVADAGDRAGQTFGQRMAGGLKNLGGAGAIAAGLGAGLAGAAVGLYKIGDTFDQVSDTIRVGTGASGEALDSLVDVAKNVGKTVPAEYSAIGQTVADLNTRLGLSGGTLQTVASQYLEAGRILGSSVDIQKTSAAFQAFGIQGEGVITAMDDLFRVSQATGVGMNDLASAVQTNAPALKSMGFSFQESAALAGQFDKAGLNSSQIMGSLGKAMVNLAKDGKAPGQAFTQVTGEIQGFLAKGNEAAALDLAAKVFGTKGAAQFVDALKTGTLSADGLAKSIGASGDTILGVGSDTQDFSEKWVLLKNNAAAALEPLGSAVFSTLGTTLEQITPSLIGFGEWLGNNQTVLYIVAGLIGVTLVGAFLAFAASVAASTIALLANPMTWIVIAVMALVAAIIALWQNWDSVAAWLSSTWNSVISAVGGWWDSMVAAVSGAMQGVWDAITNAWNSVVGFITGVLDGIGSTIASAWNSVYTTVSTWISTIVSTIGGLPGKALSALASLGSMITGVASSAWNSFSSAVTSGISTVISTVTGLPGKIVSTLGNLGSLLLDSGKSLVDGFLRGIKGAWDGMVGWVKSGMDKLRGLWPFSPARWGPFSGRGYTTYSGRALVDGFAQGIEAGQPRLLSAAEDTVRVAGLAEQTSLGPRITPPTAASDVSAAPASGVSLELNVDLERALDLIRLIREASSLGRDVRSVLPGWVMGGAPV